MQKYLSSIILAIIFVAAVWAILYEKDRMATSSEPAAINMERS